MYPGKPVFANVKLFRRLLRIILVLHFMEQVIDFLVIDLKERTVNIDLQVLLFYRFENVLYQSGSQPSAFTSKYSVYFIYLIPGKLIKLSFLRRTDGKGGIIPAPQLSIRLQSVLLHFMLQVFSRVTEAIPEHCMCLTCSGLAISKNGAVVPV